MGDLIFINNKLFIQNELSPIRQLESATCLPNDCRGPFEEMLIYDIRKNMEAIR